MTDRLERAQRAVVGWAIAQDPPEPIVLDDTESAHLRLWADQVRLDGPAWAAHEHSAVVLCETEAALLRDAHVRAQHRALACEAQAAELSDLLLAHDIDSRVLKGLASSRLDVADPALRTFSDVDLLVRRRDLLAALDVLERSDHRVVEAAPARWWLRRYGRAVTLKGVAGVEIDLHAAIVVGYFGVRLQHDGLFDLGFEPIELGGVTVRALVGPARLVASAYAAVLSRGPRERLWRDVACQVSSQACDWEAAVAPAAEGDGESVLARAVVEAADATGALAGHPALEWAQSVRPSPQAQRALAWADAGEQQGWRADARSTLLALGPWDRGRFVVGAGLHSVGRRFRRGPER